MSVWVTKQAANDDLARDANNLEHTVVRHWPILAVVEGDIPATSLLMCYCGHAAINACPACCIPGVHINRGTRFVHSEGW